MNQLVLHIKNLPISRKVASFCVLISLASLLIAMTALALYDRAQFQENKTDSLTTLASVISNRSSAAVVFDDSNLAAENLATLSHEKSIVAACIFSLTNLRDFESRTVNQLAVYPHENVKCPTVNSVSRDVVHTDNLDFIELVQPIILDDLVIGYLYLKSNTLDLQTIQNNHFVVFSIIASVVFLITLWFSHRFSRWISRPLSKLRRTAENIASNDDYSIRAKKYYDDEVGKVVDSFNQMLVVIERENEEIRNSEEKFRLISASSKVGIFQLDIEGHYVFANDELCTMTGLNSTDIMSDNWLSTVHTDDKLAVEKSWKDMLNNNREIDIECRLHNSNIKWISGVIGLLHSAEGTLLGYLGTIHDVTAVKTAQIQLEKMAFYDTLTGLSNRRLFRNRLEHIVGNLSRKKTKIGLVLLDLDNFKDVNDSLGHDAGDTLLTMIADRLMKGVRVGDTVSRLGGDEFAVIFAGIDNSMIVSNIVEGLLKSLSVPITLNETQLRITASAGIAIAPNDSDNAETLIKNADLALYKAKAQGRNCFRFFTSQMNTELIDYLRLKDELHQAVNQQDFYLVFQPQIGLAKNALTGFEALIRWKHATKGFINPMDFIPAAEDTGLIIPIGRWVITAACRQLKELKDRQLITPDVVMTVNLSVKQFQDEDLVSFLLATLNEFEINPNQFEVEVTETLLMENLDEAIYKLEAIKSLWILISIDDFGTGYSSLGYLKRLPIDIVKVDRSFVTDIPADKSDMEITAAVIAMAHGLNYQVVAEGVETTSQLQFLHNCGCDYGQGYLFSRPLPKAELVEYCRRYPQDGYHQTSA